jgi:beta-carotene hydroxylase
MIILPHIQEFAADLRHVPAHRRVISLVAPFVWIALYFVLAANGWWASAVICLAALSFVTYGSTSHDLVHGNLGLGRCTNYFFLSLIELLCLRSGHAYRLAHLHHHACFPAHDDIEGAAARMSFAGTLWEGVTLQPRIWLWALGRGEKEKWTILIEGVACLLILIASVVTYRFTPIFLVYSVLMIMGSWIFPLVTVHLVHDAASEDELFQTRAYRGRVASWVAMNHLYHLEHHLYPSIPHHHWPELARRLDPHFERAGVKPNVILF